ncbi:MAG: glycosyl hydrolase family 16 [Saprospirales bacterium]|nr:glycosyl hydrolase family 16 [Saprospirales bacterium]
MYRFVLLVFFSLSFGQCQGNSCHISEENKTAAASDSIPYGGYSTPESYDGFILVWQDEFNGSGQPDPTNWTYDLGDGCPRRCGWGNNEFQYYTNHPRNVYLKDGFLVLEAWEEEIEGHRYSSARIITEGLRSFKYGRIDVRAVLPEGQGIWPAIWLLGDDYHTAGWPDCGEIDIMELVGHEPAKCYGTAHWNLDGEGHHYVSGNYDLPASRFADQFHVFSLLWDDQGLTWLVDDQPYHRLTKEDFGSQNPFNNPFYLIMNIAVGGNWPGNPDETTTFPQQMVVDYVRYYQKLIMDEG